MYFALIAQLGISSVIKNHDFRYLETAVKGSAALELAPGWAGREPTSRPVWLPFRATGKRTAADHWWLAADCRPVPATGPPPCRWVREARESKTWRMRNPQAAVFDNLVSCPRNFPLQWPRAFREKRITSSGPSSRSSRRADEPQDTMITGSRVRRCRLQAAEWRRHAPENAWTKRVLGIAQCGGNAIESAAATAKSVT